MKTLSIGDIHGRSIWKDILFGDAREYEIWRTATESGADPLDAELWKDCPFMSADKIIFIGDYVDSFTVTNVIMLQNLEEIVHFKKIVGDRVVLLLGNHDVQYILNNLGCSGYRPEMRPDLYKLFADNESLFSMAYQVEASNGDSYLWTHAGVTSGWLDQLKDEMFNEHFRFFEIVEDRKPQTIADMLNLAWELNMQVLHSVDGDSGGWSKWAGPLWVRPRKLNSKYLDKISQIVGHTPVDDIHKTHIKWTDDSKTIHYYIDCLEYGSGKALELEII